MKEYQEISSSAPGWGGARPGAGRPAGSPNQAGRELREAASKHTDEALAVLAGDQYAEAVEADEQVAYSLGVTGVPFFVIDRRYGISGAQPAETIRDALDRAWAGSHA